MNKEELKKLLFIACNRIGTLTKNGEYDDGYDAMIHFGNAIKLVFMVYDNAMMDIQATTYTTSGEC